MTNKQLQFFQKWQQRKKVVIARQADLTESQWEKAEFMINTIGLPAISSEEDPSCSSDEECDRRRLGSRLPTRRIRKVKEHLWRSQEAKDIMLALDDGHDNSCTNVRSKKMKWTLIRDETCSVSTRRKPDNIPEWMENKFDYL